MLIWDVFSERFRSPKDTSLHVCKIFISTSWAVGGVSKVWTCFTPKRHFASLNDRDHGGCSMIPKRQSRFSAIHQSICQIFISDLRKSKCEGELLELSVCAFVQPCVVD